MTTMTQQVEEIAGLQKQAQEEQTDRGLETFVQNFPLQQLVTSPDLMRAVLSPAPRHIPSSAILPLLGELLIADGQYIFHYWEREETYKATPNYQEHYKFLSPRQVASAFAAQSLDTGWLPSRTLRWGTGKIGDWIVQYIPARPTLIRLEGKDRPLIVPMPPFIFTGVSGKAAYRIWAVKSSYAKVGPSTQLFHAPLPNVYPGGDICWGNAQPAVGSITSDLEKAFSLFMSESVFNGHLANGKSRSQSSDVRRLLEKIGQEQSALSPDAALIVAGLKGHNSRPNVTGDEERDFAEYETPYDEEALETQPQPQPQSPTRRTRSGQARPNGQERKQILTYPVADLLPVGSKRPGSGQIGTLGEMIDALYL